MKKKHILSSGKIFKSQNFSYSYLAQQWLRGIRLSVPLPNKNPKVISLFVLHRSQQPDGSYGKEIRRFCSPGSPRHSVEGKHRISGMRSVIHEVK